MRGVGDSRMKINVRVSRNRPHTFSVCGEGKSAITFTGIRITDCLRGKNERYSLRRAVGPT